MMKTYMPCLDCSYALQAINPSLERTWIWLAEARTLEDPFVKIFRHDGLELEDNFFSLEQMRFIVTHEVEPHWHLVKLLGFREGSQLICVHRHMT